MKKDLTAGLVKISELAEASGTNVSTLKFYVKEGLISPQCKTGPNMAYYSPDCVSQIKTIRRLQKERFYPLSVIKRLMNSPMVNLNEIEMLNAIYKVSYDSTQRRFTVAEASKASGISRDDIERVIGAGLITPHSEGKKRLLSEDDIGTLLLIKKRRDAGIPFEQSIAAFSIYSKALELAAAEDVDGFITGALMQTMPDADKGARMIRTSDETIDTFIGIKRSQFNRKFGAVRVEDLETFSSKLKCVLNGLEKAFAQAGLDDYADICHKAGAGDSLSGCSATLEAYASLTVDHKSDVASGIAACIEAREHFSALMQNAKAGASVSLLEFSLALCWLSLAPGIIGGGAAPDDSVFLNSIASQTIEVNGKGFADAVLSIITELGGKI